MSALTGSILVLAFDDVHATELVAALLAAGADTVVAANALEALQRLEQFKFDAAVIDCSPGAEGIAEQLGLRGVPFCVCGSMETATGWKPAVVTHRPGRPHPRSVVVQPMLTCGKPRGACQRLLGQSVFDLRSTSDCLPTWLP